MSAAEGDAAAVAGQLAELKVLAAEFRQAVRDHTAAVVAYEQRLVRRRR